MGRDFIGLTDRVDWANIYNTAGAHTLSIWVYPDTIATVARYLWIVHNSTDAGAGTLLFFVFVDGTNTRIAMNAIGSTNLQRVSANISIASLVGSWHHILYTWDGSTTATNVHIYLDGTEVSYVGDVNGSTFTAATGKWSLGGRIWDDARNFDGKIDEVGVWNRVLDAGEISSLATGRMPRSIPSGLMFDANLDKGSLIDSVTGATGTADGTTAFTDRVLYVPLTETGLGTDAISISTLEEIIKSIVDTGTGLDRLSQLLASLTVRDLGTGLDVASLLQAAFKQISDAGLGSDAITIQASLTTRDVGTGTDYDDILLILTISENGTGQELLSLSALLSRSDVSTGIDNPSLAASLGLSDGALGGDFLDLSALLNVPEQGSGNDIRKEMPSNLILHFEPKNDGTPELNDITHDIVPSTFTGFVTGTAGIFGSRGAYFGTTTNNTKYQFLRSILNTQYGTVSFWFNWTGGETATTKVLFDAGGLVEANGFSITFTSTEIMRVRINGVTAMSGATSAVIGTWYHVIFTYDFVNDLYRLYINNALNATTDTAFVEPTYPLEICIGNRLTDAAFRPSESWMDDLVILNHVATEQERINLFNGYYADTLSLSASIPISEIGSGSDSISILTALLKLISDSGLGSDQVSISVSLSVQDTGAGVEGLSIQVSLTVLDAGTGIDVETVTKVAIILKSLSDLASGSDSLSISASLNIGDAIIGIDDPAILASLSLGDTSRGLESPVISANLTITDLSSATDILSILQSILKQIADSGTGSDVISQISASLSVSETGLGTDQLSQLLASLIVTDFGEGVDVVVAYDSSTQIIKITFLLKQRSMTFSLSKRSMGFTINPLQN